MALSSPRDAATFEEETSSFDWTVLVGMLCVFFIGLVNIYSVTHGQPGAFWLRQLIFVGAGMGVIGLVTFFDYRIIQNFAYILYGLNFLALSAVEFIGVLKNGSRRWIDFGPIHYQPSETMKFLVILALAKYFHDKQSLQKLGWKELLVPGLIVGVPALLTIAQPDLGTGGHIMLIGATMIAFMGVKRKVIVTLALLGLISIPLGWKYGLKQYQRQRVMTFIDPTKDPRGTGYNALQSMIAVGSGEFMGKGFEQGSQTQLEFTPESHTDFIFSVLAEEWGFLGAGVLFGLYMFIFGRCIRIASLAREKFGSLVCVGVIGMIISQIFINVAMVTGMFPIVGIPLPMVSYGGTSVLTTSLGFGLILSIGYRRTIF
ncbi:MAG TPA: rod shape-determining protein RodA [Bdellovibrionota bacterium]|jgi:rod shape determining protein RodA|nr:rod shape-determining protein RodA [Bdellovibrionota bacterium]